MDNSQIQQDFDRYNLNGQRRASMLCIKKDHKGIDKTAAVSFHVSLFTICIKYSFIESTVSQSSRVPPCIDDMLVAYSAMTGNYFV
uniref:Uncharacterized protein n=1 Tax=Hucho hucho TaxID=62062 RepID=A0A4W5M003_9TELE